MQSLRFKMRYSIACPDLTQNRRLFVLQFRRNDGQDRTANDFVGRVTKHPLGCGIPVRNDTVEILGNNGIVGGIDNGSESSMLRLDDIFESVQKTP